MEPFSSSIEEFCKRHSRDLHYSCMGQSPIPFENPSISSSMCFATGPSPPFGAAPDRFQVDEGGQSFTPSPCVGDSVMLGRDWPGLYTEAHTYGSTPWNSEPVCVTQGGLVQYGNSGTIHHYGTPQNFQSLQRNSCSTMQYGTHFLGDLDLCEEQDCRVTSSTEASPWKPLSHMPEILNSMVPQCSGPLNWQSDGLNVPDERNVASHMMASNTPGVCIPDRETVAAQTPWKLKKHKRHLSLQNAASTNNVQKIGQSSQTRNTLSYDRQKALQRKREHAIRDEVYKLCALLPWQERDKPPSKNEILRKAISYIGTLECKVGKICQEMGIMWPSCKVDMPQEFPPKAPKELVKLKEEDAKDFSATKEELGATSEPAVTELDCLRNILNSHTNIDNCNLSPQKELGDSRVKRPMNAFLIFSKKNRKKYQDKYPGRDNRKITTLMAEDWNRMREAEKKPFKDEADEEMRKKKEDPRFKYCIQAKKIPQVVVCSTAKNGGNGFRVGNHILRARKREGSVDTKSAKCVKVEVATD